MNIPEVSLPFLYPSHPSGLCLLHQLSMAQNESSSIMVHLVKLCTSSSNNNKRDELKQASFERKLSRYTPQCTPLLRQVREVDVSVFARALFVERDASSFMKDELGSVTSSSVTTASCASCCSFQSHLSKGHKLWDSQCLQEVVFSVASKCGRFSAN